MRNRDKDAAVRAIKAEAARQREWDRADNARRDAYQALAELARSTANRLAMSGLYESLKIAGIPGQTGTLTVLREHDEVTPPWEVYATIDSGVPFSRYFAVISAGLRNAPVGRF